MEAYEDEVSNVSLVSTISATSSVHQPQPPDGPKPSTRGFRARKSKVVRSPYLATSTPYHPAAHPRNSSASVTFHPREGGTLGSKSAPTITRDKWVAAVKSSGFNPECWSSPSVHSSASSFLQSLMKTPSFSAVVTANMKKKKKGSQSTAGGRSRSHLSPDPIALQDEIVRLKKEVNSVSRERDLERAQRRKLELELGKKVKQIDDLLSSGHITSHDATRSLVGGRKTDGSDPTGSGNAVVSSLRQQLHTLEQALRGKERAYATLQRDVRASRVKELEVEGEIYYQEVCRLRALLEQHGAVSPRSMQETQTKLRALSDAVVKLSSQLEQAESVNKHLEEDMKRLRHEHHHLDSFVHNEQGLRGSIADKYADHKRSEMLSAVVDLELRLQEKEKTLQSLCREFDQKRSHYERRIGALTGSHNDAVAQVKLLEGRLTEAESLKEKLRNIVRKLKEDRAHYRSLAENTQVELEGVHDRLQCEEVRREGVVQELNVLREKHQSEMVAAEHAHKLAKRTSHVFSPDKKRQEAAAAILQQLWRKRKAVKRQQKFQDSMEQATINIQRALQGHLARKSLLEPSSPLISSPTPNHSSSDSVAIEAIQSALRGHLARHLALQDIASNATENRQFLATELSASGSTIAKPSAGVGASNMEECSSDGKVGKRHSNKKISRSVLVDCRPPELYSQVHHVGKREGQASENQARRRNQEEETYQTSPHTSNYAGNFIPPWGAGRGEESSGSEVGNADVESSDDEPSPVTPSHHLMLSSNDSEAPPEHSDQVLLADELL